MITFCVANFVHSLPNFNAGLAIISLLERYQELCHIICSFFYHFSNQHMMVTCFQILACLLVKWDSYVHPISVILQLCSSVSTDQYSYQKWQSLAIRFIPLMIQVLWEMMLCRLLEPWKWRQKAPWNFLPISMVNIPEDLHLHQYCHENIISWIMSLLVTEEFYFCSLQMLLVQ
jgi:hypothetical protein